MLAVGILAVEGHFSKLEMVSILSDDGRELARGLSSLSSTDLQMIIGLSSEQIRAQLGPVADAIVHRDQLVLRIGSDTPSIK